MPWWLIAEVLLVAWVMSEFRFGSSAYEGAGPFAPHHPVAAQTEPRVFKTASGVPIPVSLSHFGQG
jgi:hypothetical protein